MYSNKTSSKISLDEKLEIKKQSDWNECIGSKEKVNTNLVVDSLAHIAYVTYTEARAIAAVDTNSTVDVIWLDVSPDELAIDKKSNTLYVTSMLGSAITAIDLSTHEIKDIVDTNYPPTDLVVDAKGTVYLTLDKYDATVKACWKK